MKKHLRKLIPILLLLGLMVIVLPTVTSCSSNIPGVDGSEVVNLLFPQPIVFAAQIIATVILFFIASKFVWKPFNEMLEKRKAFVMSEIKEVEAKKVDIYKQEQQLKEEYLKTQEKMNKMLQDARNESNNIIYESKIQAKQNYDESIKNANIEIDRLKTKIKHEMEQENIDLVIAATEQLAMKNIDSNDNRKFVEDFLEKVDKEL